MTSVAPCTDEEIAERINVSTSSYTMESNEDTFKPDMVFESFHHQSRVPISDRALLVGFLMLWLKRYVVPTLPHEVIVADVVYPAVLLAYEKSIALLPAMVARIQSGLQALVKSLCQVEAIVDSKGRPEVDSEGRPKVKTPQPQDRASIHVPDGLVRYALPFTDDGGAFLRRFRSLHAETGEFELVSLIYVLCSEIQSEQFELLARLLLP